MLRRLCLLSLLTLSACGTSVTVAEKSHEQAQEPDAGGAGGAGAVQSMPCGTTQCAARTVPGALVETLPCCLSEATSTCGIAAITKCFPINAVGHVDTDCGPQFTTPFGMLQGCCRPDNSCGLYESQFGFGCIPFADISELFKLPGNLPGNLPGLGPGFGTCTYNP